MLGSFIASLCALRPVVAIASGPDAVHDPDVGSDVRSHEPIEPSLDVTELGGATWVDARVDVPIGHGLSLFPQGALLHVAKVQDSDEEWHPFVGAGAAWEPIDAWHFELSVLYGPPADDLESTGGEFAIERDFGGDEDSGAPVVLELDGSLSVKQVHWEDGRGPAGSNVVQAFADLAPVWRPTSRLEVRPRAMLFVYDRSLDQAVGNRLGSISVLAREGTFAPRALGGLEVGYSFLRWLTPSIAASEIVYTSGVGDATEFAAGVRVHLVKGLTVTVGGGWLWNRVGGSLVPEEDRRSLPLARLEISAAF